MTHFVYDVSWKGRVLLCADLSSRTLERLWF